MVINVAERTTIFSVGFNVECSVKLVHYNSYKPLKFINIFLVMDIVNFLVFLEPTKKMPVFLTWRKISE